MNRQSCERLSISILSLLFFHIKYVYVRARVVASHHVSNQVFIFKFVFSNLSDKLKYFIVLFPKRFCPSFLYSVAVSDSEAISYFVCECGTPFLSKATSVQVGNTTLLVFARVVCVALPFACSERNKNVYKHTYVCVCIHTYVFVCIRMYVCVYTYTCMYVYTHTHVCMCIHIHMYVCVHHSSRREKLPEHMTDNTVDFQIFFPLTSAWAACILVYACMHVCM